MNPLKFLLPMAVMAIGAGMAATVCAQESIDEAERLAREARALMDEGVAAMSQKNKRAAHKAMKKSFEMRESYDIACNLGLLENEFGNYQQSAEYLDFCLINYPTGGSRKKFQEIRTLYEKVQRKVGILQVTVNNEGATVIVDEQEVGTTPLEDRIFVEPGQHEVTARLDTSTETQGIFIEKGETKEIYLHLDEPKAGSEANADAFAHTPTETTKRPSLAPAYILGGLSLGAFGSSMVFRVLADEKASDIDALRASTEPGECFESASDDCDRLASLRSTQRTFSTTANVTLIASGALAAGTVGYVIYALTKKGKPSHSALTVVPYAGRNGAGFTLSGNFHSFGQLLGGDR